MPPRKIAAVVKIALDAGKASPMAVGKALAPRGVDLGAFMTAYNAQTAARRGDVIPAEVTVYDDRSFTFRLKTPPTAALLARAAGIPKGAQQPNGAPVAWISRAQLRSVAERKLPDLNAYDLDGAERVVAGTAHSMGIGIRD
jgi:large subunit ribosomal protein L11